MASKRPDLRRAFTDTESGAFVSDASAEVMDAAFTRGNAMTTGNLNVLSWEGDGQQRRFVIDGRAPMHERLDEADECASSCAVIVTGPTSPSLRKCWCSSAPRS